MMIQRVWQGVGALGLALVLLGCSPSSTSHTEEVKAPTLPPEPVVNHAPSDAQPGQRIEHGELILDVDEAKKQLNAQHHSYKVLETRKVPGPFQPPAMTDVKDFALSKSDLDVINPGPGEYVHVMEGQRHGYDNLTIGITYTAPGGAPPMHTHKGEESHVLLKGQKVLYALGDKLFVKEGPYIVNVPPGVPHSFQTWTMRSRNSS
jgi:quercetin dioxygenase-like cupin family protein